MNWTHLIIGVIVILLLIAALVVSGIYAIKASLVLKSSIYDNDASLKSAHNYLVWASVTAWGSLGSAAIIIVLAIFGGIFFEVFGGAEVEAIAVEGAEGAESEAAAGAKKKEGGLEHLIEIIVKVVIYIIIFAIVLLAVTTGTLCVLAALKIRGSSEYKQSNPEVVQSYQDCIIASVAGFSALIIVGFIVLLYILQHERNKHKEKNE